MKRTIRSKLLMLSTLSSGGIFDPAVNPPIILSTRDVNISENLLLAIPLTANETVTWSIIPGLDAAKFEILGTILRWLGGGTKNYEFPDDSDLNNVYNVVVRATDLSAMTRDATFNVTVLDSVEPILMLSNTSISENLTIGTTVGTLSVSGGGIGTAVYSLINSAGGRFAISGTTLQTNAVLDYEAATSHSITVGVTGLTTNPDNTTFTITVIDVAEPVILLSGMLIAEDAAVSTVVGALTIGNSYTGSPTYAMVDSAGGKFGISGSNLVVASALDYETAMSHNITISVSGITPAAVNKVFTIVIVDAAEAAGTVVKWDAAAKGSNLTLSGGDLTVTSPSGSFAVTSVRSTQARWIGKYYFEITIVEDSSLAGFMYIGIATPPVNMDGPIAGGPATYFGLGAANDGAIYVSSAGSSIGIGTTYAEPNTVGIAVDFNNEMIWFRTGTGIWNGNAAYNPTTNTGGVYMTAGGLGSGRYAPYYGAVSLLQYTTGQIMTANFGATAYVGTAPSGFVNFDTGYTITWDPAAKNASHSLSSDLMTVTSNAGAASGPKTTRTTGAYATSKVFCTFTIVEAGTNLTYVGIEDRFASLNSFPGLENYPAHGCSYASNGNVYYMDGSFGNLVYGPISTYTTGDVIYMAIDFPNKKIWFKKNTGNWNNNGSANPATNTGGFDLSSMLSAIYNIFCAAVAFNSETAGVGDVTFSGSATGAPSGFQGWDETTTGGSSVATRNIVTDYGAVAGAESAVVTLTAIGHTLTSGTSIWSSDDVGKTIVVGNAGGSGPQGGSPLLTTISGYTSGFEITITAAVVYEFTAMENVHVAWGVNNGSTYSASLGTIDGPFAAFRAAYQDKEVNLTIPAGNYLIANGNFGGLWDGIRKITVEGAGARLCGGSFQLQASAQTQFAGMSAATASVSAGATYVTLIDPTLVSRFAVGDYALMTGLTLQYGGFPSNHQLFEYLLITAIDSDSASPTYGKISFLTSLINGYLSTWPIYLPETGTAPTGTFSYGGPATLYAMNHKFNHTLIVNNLTVAHHAQWPVAGRSITMNDCVFEGNYGPYPTMAMSVVFNNCLASISHMEVDKYVRQFTMTGCAWGGIGFQSASNSDIIIDNCDVTYSITGTPRKLTIRNGSTIGVVSGIGILSPGPVYGYANELIVTDSTIKNFGAVGTHESGMVLSGGAGGSTGIDVDYEMVSGVIKIPSTFFNNTYTSLWTAVGGKCFFYDANIGTIGSFTITAVTKDSSYVYVTTDRAGGFPPRTYNPLFGLRLVLHPAPRCTFSNVDGCEQALMLSNMPADTPLYSRFTQTYTPSSVTGTYWQLYGRIKSITVTVSTPYSGASATCTLTLSFGNAAMKMSDYTNYVWAPVIDLKTGGTRTFNATAGTYPVNWSGGVGADVLTGHTEAIWSASNFRALVSGYTPGTGPVVSIDIITDQGFA